MERGIDVDGRPSFAAAVNRIAGLRAQGMASFQEAQWPISHPRGSVYSEICVYEYVYEYGRTHVPNHTCARQSSRLKTPARDAPPPYCQTSILPMEAERPAPGFPRHGGRPSFAAVVSRFAGQRTQGIASLQGVLLDRVGQHYGRYKIKIDRIIGDRIMESEERDGLLLEGGVSCEQ